MKLLSIATIFSYFMKLFYLFMILTLQNFMKYDIINVEKGGIYNETKNQ